MQFKTSIHDYEIQNIFDRFKRVIGEKNWRHRVKLLEDEIRGNRFLRHHHLEKNDIAFALAQCSDWVKVNGTLPVRQIDFTPIYPAIAFAAHCLAMLDLMDAANRARTVRRIQGAFNNPEDMRALQLEFTAAIHFVKRGQKIAWPELEGDETYDLLVEDLGPLGLEVECKSVSESKGRKITNRDAIDFWNLMQPELMASARNLNTGLSIVLTLPSKLPVSFKDRKHLAKQVVRAILSGQSHIQPETEISFRDFNPSVLDGFDWKNGQGPRELIDSITGTRNQQAMITGLKGGGVVVFAIQSRQDDSLFSSMEKTVKRAATDQLSGTRPGLILVEFNGLSPDAVVDLAAHDNTPGSTPTSLRIWASDFLSNTSDRNHIVGIGFLSKGEMTRHDPSVVTSGGSVYLFPRSQSPLWNEAFSGLFDSVDET